MKIEHIFPNNMSLRAALQWATQLGCVVRWLRRTGEVAVIPPGPFTPMRRNGRAKDAGKKLVGLLRRLYRWAKRT